MVRDWMDEPPLPPLLLLVLAFGMVAGVWGAAPRPPVRLALAPGLCDVVKLTVALNKSTVPSHHELRHAPERLGLTRAQGLALRHLLHDAKTPEEFMTGCTGVTRPRP